MDPYVTLLLARDPQYKIDLNRILREIAESAKGKRARR